MGYNSSGQIARTDSSAIWGDTGLSNVSKIAAGYYHGYALKDDGSIWSVGRNNYSQLGRNGSSDQSTWGYSGLSNVSDIFGGGNYGYAVNNEGKFWSVGQNSEGQLGLGDTTNRSEWTELVDPFKEP